MIGARCYLWVVGNVGNGDPCSRNLKRYDQTAVDCLFSPPRELYRPLARIDACIHLDVDVSERKVAGMPDARLFD